MKIGLFGGTFDPIHLGHLRAVKEVSERFGLSLTYLIPASQPPHKPHRVIAPAKDRVEMIRLAVGSMAEFEISDIELNREGPSYTIDTLKHFKRLPGATDRTYYLIMGLDAFLEIDTWKVYLDVFKQVPVIIMARPSTGDVQADVRWERVADFIHSKISDQYCCSDTGALSKSDEYQPIHFMDVSLLDISATRIRDFISQGKSIQFLVPEKVERYIRQQGLYE
jgi:nicotinate-nucleotide adenylyltransferase